MGYQEHKNLGGKENCFAHIDLLYLLYNLTLLGYVVAGRGLHGLWLAIVWNRNGTFGYYSCILCDISLFFFPLLYSGYTYLYFYVRSKRVPASDFTGWILGELDEGGWAVNELRLRRRGDAIYPR